MDRNTLGRRVEIGVMTLLVATLVVMFAMNYDPNSRKVLDEFLNGSRNSSTVADETSSSKDSLFEESNSSDTSNKSDDITENHNSVVYSEPASNPSSKTETPGNTPQTGLININTADSDQLQQLDGIGKVKAQAIIDYRETHGAFRTIDELTKVSGIGEKTLEKNRDRITV